MRCRYARANTTDQDPTSQLDELKAAGCEKLYAGHRVYLGRRRELTPQQRQQVSTLLNDPDENARKSVPAVADLLGVYRVTRYRKINEAKLL